MNAADGLDIVDYKTDAISPDEVEERADRYRPPLDMYARAMARIWRREVRTCWLVFLTPRKLVSWSASTDP